MSSKACFVTCGATASFSALVEAALTPEFAKALESHGYTDMIVQYGQDGKSAYDKGLELVKGKTKVNISGFDLDKGGLGRYMRQAKAVGASSSKDSSEGVVISHAGSGTIMDALRISVPLVVVPNEALLDNHQVELAETLANQEYVVHGKLGNLPQALQDAEKLRQRQREWPPPNSKEGKDIRPVVDDEMGYLD